MLKIANAPPDGTSSTHGVVRLVPLVPVKVSSSTSSQNLSRPSDDGDTLLDGDVDADGLWLADGDTDRDVDADGLTLADGLTDGDTLDEGETDADGDTDGETDDEGDTLADGLTEGLELELGD